MVSVLAKIFGTENLEMAEDVIQEALLSALETWKYKGIPDNPKAWLYRVAKNKAIDIVRRNKHSETVDFSDPQKQLLTSEYTLATTMDGYFQETHIEDDFLGMMYACCHPDINRDQQITIILKSLCGFSTKEIAKSFLTNEDTVSKRISRTKEYFRNNKTKPEIPDPDSIGARTGTVLNTIYLMFNEGYNSTHSEDIIREDLISQAMHLCKSMLNNERTKLPEVYALMALMCFHAARSEGRVSAEGELLLLEKQNRQLWDQDLIEAANKYLNASAFGEGLTQYHLEAAIAYQHCAASSYGETDWKSILGYYDVLMRMIPDPIVKLNRVLVVMQLYGPEKAEKEMSGLGDSKQMQNYYLFHAISGAVHEGLGNRVEAVKSFKRASQITQSAHEKKLLNARVSTLLN